MPESIKSIAALREQKRLSKERLELSNQKLKAMTAVAKMNILVPDLIRDKNDNIDFTKALTHLTIALLPIIYDKLKDQNDEQSKSLIELLQPLITEIINNQMNKTKT